ncbi:hypothetical protein KIN20_026057 [Parelaphostrongylus tenuis]|uniref:Uncharacterized protein n=1 Tax=Parelaphostrongylus tenuis TaxID=148309 RepID=A0AAD5NB60_PARTN|nr:hypothetical protein KIN20_026057 [Parelaphostrongylus tenuis]
MEEETNCGVDATRIYTSPRTITYTCAQVLVRKNQRITVTELLKTGMKHPIFLKLTGTKPASVYRAVKCVKGVEGIEDCHRKGRPTTSSTPKKHSKIRRQCQRNPERSIRNMAREARDQRQSVRNNVKSKLMLRSYKIACDHFVDKKDGRRKASCASPNDSFDR